MNEKEKNVESDLAIKDEMSFAISNLIEIEEHLSVTIGSTRNQKYLPILNEIRKLRAKYMKEYIGNKNLKGNDWCTIKHIFSVAYRLTEVAVKNIILDNNDKAIENLQDSTDMFKLAFMITQMSTTKEGFIPEIHKPIKRDFDIDIKNIPKVK